MRMNGTSTRSGWPCAMRRMGWFVALQAGLFRTGFAVAAVAAPDVLFDIQPQRLAVGDTAQAVFVIRGIENPPAPDLPAMSGLQVQSSSRSPRIQILNRQTSREVVVEYQLLAVQTGRFTVVPVPYEAGGRVWNLPPVEIEISPSASPSASVPDFSDALFARIEATRSTLYVQETLPLMLSVYSLPDVPLAPAMSLDDLPSGGVAFSPWEELGQMRERVNNRLYDVRRFRTRMRALAAANLTVAPKLKLQVRVPRTNRRGSFFDEAFFDSMFNRDEVRAVDVPVQPFSLQIRSLPSEGRPAGFNGAVGQFRMEAAVVPEMVTAGEPVTLRVVLSGEGNLDTLVPPALDAGPDFRAYGFRLSGQQIPERGGPGSKTFEQVFLPLSEVSTNLPAVEFFFFDPKRETYETLRQGPFPLGVKPAAEGVGRVVESATNGLVPALRIEGSDILYLKKAPRSRLPPMVRRVRVVGLAGGLLIPPLFALGAWTGVRRRDRLRKDVALARRVRAPRMAREQLSRAEVAARKADRRAVFEAIWQALSAYYGNRLNLPAGEVTEEAVVRPLDGTEEGRRLVSSVREWFRVCEVERFGAGTPDRYSKSAELLDAVNAVSRLLRSCERVPMR